MIGRPRLVVDNNALISQLLLPVLGIGSWAWSGPGDDLPFTVVLNWQSELKKGSILSLFDRFNNLDFLFQQDVHHFAERYAFLRRAFGQISLYIGVQIDRQAKFSVWPKELAAFPFAEIIFGFHRCSS
jgi:hypothetical protein